MPVQPGKLVLAILVNIVKISRKSNENGMAIFLNINRVEIFFLLPGVAIMGVAKKFLIWRGSEKANFGSWYHEDIFFSFYMRFMVA